MRGLLTTIRVVAVVIPVIAFWVYIDKVEGAFLPTWICFVVSGLLILIYKIVAKDIQGKETENRISFWDYCKTQEDEDYLIDIEKKAFFKRNKNLIKRGQNSINQRRIYKIRAWKDEAEK